MNNFRENCKSTCKTINFLKNIGSSHHIFLLRIFEDLFFYMIIKKKCNQKQPITDEYVMKDGLKELGF